MRIELICRTSLMDEKSSAELLSRLEILSKMLKIIEKYRLRECEPVKRKEANLGFKTS